MVFNVVRFRAVLSLSEMYLLNLSNFSVIKKSYSIPCTSSYECNSFVGLQCPNTTGNCNCPMNSSSIFCDCTRTMNNEYYWNGSSCVLAASVNQSCMASYMCQTITQGTICNTSCTPFNCQCPLFQYFNVGLNKCQNQLLFNQSCSNNNTCRSDLGLICFSGYCR